MTVSTDLLQMDDLYGLVWPKHNYPEGHIHINLILCVFGDEAMAQLSRCTSKFCERIQISTNKNSLVKASNMMLNS